MEECPKCGVWMLDVDPRTQTQKCYNCGYEKKIEDIESYYLEKDVTHKLFLFSPKRVLSHKAFRFCISIDKYTGESAESLEEFAQKIKEIDFKSIEFHFNRGDFEKWVVEVFGDKKLAEEIKELRKQNHVNSALRGQLYRKILARAIE